MSEAEAQEDYSGMSDNKQKTSDTPPTLPVTKLSDWVRSAKPLHKKGGKVKVRMPGGPALVVTSEQDIDPNDIPE